MDDEIRNSFTRELDKHLKNKIDLQTLHEGYHDGSYLEEDDTFKNTYYFRFPGATRGYMTVNENNIITYIYFHEHKAFSKDIGCYNRSVIEATKKFIGQPFEKE